MRTGSGYRVYNPDTLERLAFIKKAQRLGLTLAEIKQILNIYNKGQAPCSHVQKMISQKISEIDTQVKDLLALRQDLQELLYWWESANEKTFGGEVICPHIQGYPAGSGPKQPSK
jgi:DNA-binding transcriptional MerR regulator